MSAPATVSVTVTPASATLNVGDSQQFAAHVTGSTNQAVTWAATGGTVTSTGLFTASTAGSSTVTATSVASPSHSAVAQVTVNSKPSVSVTITPASATLNVGDSQQFAANQAVTWTAAGGTVTPTGLFTATTAGNAVVTATSVANSSNSAQATVTVNNKPVVSVTVTPASATLTVGDNQQFAANQAVTWTATGGTVTPTGLFTATTAGNAVVTATSVANSSNSAQAQVTVNSKPAVSVTITPASATLNVGDSQQFIAKVTGSTNQAVTWTATGGTVTPAGLFTASIAGNAVVTATSVANSSSSAQATVTVNNKPAGVQVTVAPASIALLPGQSQVFSATVSGSANTLVTWAATGGSITSNGTFTASNVTGPITVTATSAADTTQSASAAITVGPYFPSTTANWLYSGPKLNSTGIDISSTTASLSFYVNTHDGGWDYPVQSADGTSGYTAFNDVGHYGRNDHYNVPNPAGGYKPSLGSPTGTDGHLVVVDYQTRVYYDFWQLTLNSSGQPNANVGQIVSGSLDTSDGTPGTTAAQISGLAGTILPGELDCVTCLHHALNVVVPASMNSPLRGTQAPIQGSDGGVTGGILREGAKLFFDPTINVNSLPASTAVKAILTALQIYGGLITDQTGGSGVSFYSGLATQPDMTGSNLIGQHMLIYY